MLEAVRCGTTIRCPVHGCDQRLGTIMQGPHRRSGTEVRTLILLAGLRKAADGVYRRPEADIVNHGRIPASVVGLCCVWTVQRHRCAVGTAPDDAEFPVACPRCGVELSVDLKQLATDLQLVHARAFARLPEAAAQPASLQGPEVALALLGRFLESGRRGSHAAERSERCDE